MSHLLLTCSVFHSQSIDLVLKTLEHTAIISLHSINQLVLCLLGVRKEILNVPIGLYGGRDSSVGIATRYGLDGPGIESRWRRDFPHPSRPALGPPSLLYNGYRVFPAGKPAGAWC